MSARPHRVLFVCAENACQSQMAEGWLRALGGDAFLVRSAGVRPRHLHPLATRAMQEVGVDIAAQRGKGFDAVRHERFDVVVTLCGEAAGALPPFVGAPELRHAEIGDPTWLEDEHGHDIEEFRRVRLALRELVAALISSRAAAGCS